MTLKLRKKRGDMAGLLIDGVCTNSTCVNVTVITLCVVHVLFLQCMGKQRSSILAAQVNVVTHWHAIVIL